MSDRKTTVTFLVSVAFLIPGLLSFAQSPNGSESALFRIKAIRQQLVAAPDYRTTITGTAAKSMTVGDKWLRIETDFDSTPEWADDVQLKYYVLMGKGPSTRLFAGDVTYVNVARGLRHCSAMFIHPNTVQRYGNGQVEAVAVQLFYKGRLVDQSSTPPTSDRWWERYTPVSGYLLNPLQTPWSILTFDRYEALKPTQ